MAARRYKGAWWTDFRFNRERIRRKSPVDTKRGAEEHERRLRQRLMDGLAIDADDKPTEVTTLGEFADQEFMEYAGNNNKPSEQASKRSVLRHHLRPAFGAVRLDAIDSRAVESYKAAKLASGLNRKTINNHLTILRKLLHLAVEYGVLTAVPRLKWFKTADPGFDFLDFEEADRLLTASGEDRTLLLVAVRTGLRLGELRALRWQDVDLVAGRLNVRQAVTKKHAVGTPKNGREREVPLAESVRQALKAHRHLRGPLVFCNEGGDMLTEGEVRWPLERACKRAGLRDVGIHVLRHTFASHLAMRGVPVKTIQELLGHRTIQTTMRYAHLAPEVRRDAVELLDGSASGGHQVGTGAKPRR